MPRPKLLIDKLVIKNAIERSHSLAQAANLIGCSYQTFARRAAEFGLHQEGKNEGLKGVSKPWTKARKNAKNLDKILTNETPEDSSRLKWKLFRAGLKKNQCEECGIKEWNKRPLMCHLEHVNGNRRDNSLENLKILCPNCHSQTPTYCRGQGKNNASLA